MDFDANWDYNCPQYVDFSGGGPPEDENADKWFELDHEDFEEESKLQIEESSGPCTRQQAKLTPSNSEHPNVYTSLSEWRAHKPKPTVIGIVAPLRTGKHPNSTGSDASPVLSTAKKLNTTNENDESPVFSTESRKTALKRQRTSGSNIQKSASQEQKTRTLKRSNSAANSCSVQRVTRSHNRGYSVDRSGSTGGKKKDENDAPSAKLPRLLTKPETPKFMRKKQLAAGSPKVKTTEEQELERIAEMRQQLAKKRKIAMDSLKKSKTSSGYAPVHSVKEPTQPINFKFNTDTRIKSQQQDLQDETCSDFARSLRSQNNATMQAPKGLTRPQPFKLSASHKAPATQLEKYQSMAQSIAAFHRATPDRFRRKPRRTSSDRKLLKARSPRKLRITQPETPKLETRSRHRPPTVPSQKEIEEKEYEEIKKHQFRAHPVNSKIMSQPTGLHKPAPKPATQPEEFHLHLEKRIKDRQANRDPDEEEEFVFHAQPVNKKILEGTVGVKPAKEIPSTVPQSPAFALKHRVRLPVELPQDKEPEKFGLKSNPVPSHNGVPFQPKLDHKITTPEPFSFETRYRDPKMVKEALLKQQLEEEQKAREFRANPLPSLEPVLPERNTKVCTKPEPFNLMSDIRGEKKTEEWNHKVMEQEVAKQKAAASFKARPAEVLRQEPFVPEKSNRPLTDVSEIVLNTERRAETRDEYEHRKKEREAQLAEMSHEREMQKMEEEKAAIAKLRAEMVHKPNPIRKFKNVIIHGSEKAPTLPESPRFSDRLRSKVRM